MFGETIISMWAKFLVLVLALILLVLTMFSAFSGYSIRQLSIVEARIDNINTTVVNLVAKNGIKSNGGGSYSTYLDGVETPIEDVANELIKKHKLTKLYSKPGTGFRVEITSLDGQMANPTMRANTIEAVSTVVIPMRRGRWSRPKYSNPKEYRAAGTIHQYVK